MTRLARDWSRTVLVTVAAFVAIVALGAASDARAESGEATRVVQISVAAPGASKLERRVLRQLNVFRRQHGLKPVRANRALARAARAHALAMGRKGFFSHDSANGQSFDQRVRRYYPPGRFRSWSVGENLLWSSGKLAARRAIALWADSPGHRRNMLGASWREVGVAAVRIRSAPGTFRGLDVTIMVTDFGRRRR